MSTAACAAALLAVGLAIVGPLTPAVAQPTAWSITPSPNAPLGSDSGDRLNGVSCTSSSSCVAVGNYYNTTAGAEYTLVETWNGTTWSIVPSPNTGGFHRNFLNGVSCTSSSSCVAVGYYSAAPGAQQTLVESWNGTTWSITPSPNTSATQRNDLGGVSCTSSSSCVAVGAYYNGTSDQTLIESWNGTTWSITPSPHPPPGSPDASLTGVSCTSSSSCVAVGDSSNASNVQTLIESWNGTTWSIRPSPNTSATGNFLKGVSCRISSSCVAVGYSGTSNLQTLVESWNGTTWSIRPSPNTSATGNFLKGVSCTISSSCVAVGYSGTSNLQTLIESWNGTTWSITPSPNPSPGRSDAFLTGVSCTSPSSCVAAGGDTSGNSQTLIESGTGTSGTGTSGTGTSGYWEVASDGGILSFGAPYVGSMGGKTLNAPIVGMATDPHSSGGYWEVASDGGLFSFGAPFLGSMGGKTLNAPIVGMAADPCTGGYWEVASDGGIFSFGAPYLGSMGGKALNKPIVGIAVDPQTCGYWEVASDGGIFSFGAPFLGSTVGKALNQPIVAMAADPHSGGYWEVASDGGIFNFGSPFLGSMGGKPLNKPIVGIAALP